MCRLRLEKGRANEAVVALLAERLGVDAAMVVGVTTGMEAKQE